MRSPWTFGHLVRPGEGADLSRVAFVGGLALAVIAGIGIAASIYFADTAPRLPPSAAALEHLLGGQGNWPPPVKITPLMKPFAGKPMARPEDDLALSPRSDSPGDAPPIDAKDLPPPEPAAD